MVSFDKNLSINDKINEIFKLYINFGNNDYIGEEVSQIEHMLQAAQLALNDKQNIEVILAGLFHDIGHLLAFDDKYNSNLKKNSLGTLDHEKHGANFLRNLNFPEIIPNLIENHVKAKKYLAYKNPDYINKLSSASKQTLIEQGGLMTDYEANLFEKSDIFNLSIQLRKYDEAAKNKNFKTESLEYFKKMCKEYLKSL